LPRQFTGGAIFLKKTFIARSTSGKKNVPFSIAGHFFAAAFMDSMFR